jgi:mRNA interferase HicA
VRRAELLRKLKAVARSHGAELQQVREGGSHTVFRCGPVQFTVPRHAEVNERTARSLLRHVANELKGTSEEEDGRT